jgi:hypothetical protein
MKKMTLLHFGNERFVISRQPELPPLGTTPMGDNYQVL